MKKFLLVALSVVLVFSACQRTPKPQTPSRADIMRIGKWKLSSGTLTIKLPSGKDTVMNYLNFITPCHLDDYIVFDSQMHGEVYSGSDKCNPVDPDYIPFVWQLVDNDNALDLYNGFNSIYGIQDSISPYSFDTLFNNPSGTPPLVLDTVHGYFDTLAGYTRVIVILDTMWVLHVDTLALGNTNIYNAQISNFSSTAFTLNFNLVSRYLDTTNGHEGLPHSMPVWRADTFRYVANYTNF
jgi:hypothetical protein